jgi:hypothetical protein
MVNSSRTPVTKMNAPGELLPQRHEHDAGQADGAGLEPLDCRRRIGTGPRGRVAQRGSGHVTPEEEKGNRCPWVASGRVDGPDDDCVRDVRESL